MSGGDPDLNELGKRMDGAVDVFRKELQGLRTGRASTSLLEPVVVEAYLGRKAAAAEAGAT